jgi:hypothetical protein
MIINPSKQKVLVSTKALSLQHESYCDQNPIERNKNLKCFSLPQTSAVIAVNMDPINLRPIKTAINTPAAYSVSVKWLK